MNATAQQLFALLRAGLKTEPAAAAASPASPTSPLWTAETAPDWPALYRSTARQGVLAIAWDGLQDLIQAGLIPADRQPSRTLKLQWVCNVQGIENRYARQRQAAAQLDALLKREGKEAVVFKGLSSSRYYPRPEHRECGDIDLCLLDGRPEELEELLQSAGGTLQHRSPKHAEILFGGTLFEVHRSFVGELLQPRNKPLNRELTACLNDRTLLPGMQALYGPGPEFDTLFLLAHAATHFRTEGIVLRHIVDLMLLPSSPSSPSGKEKTERLRRYGLERFAGAIDRIASEWLHVGALPDAAVCDEETARRILEDTLKPSPSSPNERVPKGKLLLRKIRRFTSRHWTYPLLDDSFARALIRTIYSHLADPGTIFRGNK